MIPKIINSFNYNDYVFPKCYSFEYQKNVFILSENGTSIILDYPLYHKFINKDIDNNLLFKFISSGIIEIDKEVECKELPKFFMIDFTTKCNLNCIYCLRHFENEGNIINDAMLFSILDYIKNYCIMHNVKEINFQPWGGEPFIALDKIITAKDYFNNCGIIAHFFIQTNGLILNQQIIDKLKENNISIGVSIDGCKAVQDLHRVTARNKPTYDAVKNNLDQIKDNPYYRQLGTISVYTSKSYDKVKENINDFVNELSINNFKFNIVHPNGPTFDKSLLLSDSQIEEFVNNYVDEIIKLSENGIECYESNMVDKLYNLLVKNKNDLCHSSGCKGGKVFISFDQQGNIYPCEQIGDTDNLLGNVADNIDLVTLIERGKNLPFYVKRHLTDCEDCPFVYFCQGGCRASAKFNGRKPYEIDLFECKINKVMYPKLIDLIMTKPSLVEKILEGRLRIDE